MLFLQRNEYEIDSNIFPFIPMDPVEGSFYDVNKIIKDELYYNDEPDVVFTAILL
jgi:hypothetical protein